MVSSPLQGYSRYVNLMKVILPIGICFTLGLSLGWPYLCFLSKEGLVLLDLSRPDIQENRMIHPQYISTDSKGQPYQVNAEWAKQHTDSLANLTLPEGSLTLEEGELINLKAKSGTYDIHGKTLALEGGVTFTTTDGYLVETSKAQVTLDTKTIEGDAPIQGEGPAGSLRGEKGFKVEPREGGKKVITLKGPSRVVIKTAFLKKNKKSDVH